MKGKEKKSKKNYILIRKDLDSMFALHNNNKMKRENIHVCVMCMPLVFYLRLQL